MQVRKDKLETGQFYHIYSRSIAGFVIFNNKNEYFRIVDILSLYQYKDFNHKYSRFLELNTSLQLDIRNDLKNNSKKYVEIVAFCIMPTHFHLILKQTAENGISTFISKTLNCYTRYFNLRHKRTGPLWSGRFKSVLVSTDEQLLHLTRYIHLNPTSAGLITNPGDWTYSSYNEYVEVSTDKDSGICKANEAVDLGPEQYKKFVNDHKNYQRELALIKSFLIDNYTG